VSSFFCRFALVAAAGGALNFPLPPASAQEAQPPAQSAPPAPPTIRAQTSVVLLDMVVRDKKGKPVKDLTAAEVGVFEDGVAREIKSFRLVDTPVTVPVEAAAPVAPAPTQPDANRQINLVSIVIDGLDPTGRILARKAALGLIDGPLPPNTWVAVFRIDYLLGLEQRFTNDRTLLRQAIEHATAGTMVPLGERQEAVERAIDELDRQARGGDALTSQMEQAGQAAGQMAASGGANFAAARQAAAMANMLRLSMSLQAQQLGVSSLYSLLGLVKGQELLEGRKSLIYFTQWLQVPSHLDTIFRSVISEANRANVSIYTVDARGLDVAKALGSTDRAMADAARDSRRQQEDRGAGRAVTMGEVMIAETAEGALRASLQDTLRNLSQSTGGFLIANTNDLKRGTEQISSDIATHYELTYEPASSAYDGKFRSISVKIARPDVKVQTRSGYFALPPSEKGALLPYELPMLEALAAPTPPRDFDIRSAAFHFGKKPKGTEHMLVVEVPQSHLTFDIFQVDKGKDKGKQLFRLHFAVLAQVKDPDGHIVERFSQEYMFEGPAENVEGLKAGNVVFKRTCNLLPGRYTVEAVAKDRPSEKTSVGRFPLDVAAATPGVAISSLSVVRKVEPVTAAVVVEDPMRIEIPADPAAGPDAKPAAARIVPSVGDAISAATTKNVTIFFYVYPSSADANRPTLTLDFVKDGKTKRVTPELPSPDAQGRIAFMAPVPMSVLAPGVWELRAKVTQGAGSAQASTTFSIVQ
jgi:VWFA-related protein